MKNLFFLALLAVGTLFVSCGDDDEATPEDFITASIDGLSFAADTIAAISDNTFGEPIIFSTGTEASSSDVIGLNIPLSTPLNTPFMIDATDFAITFTDAAENAFFTVGEITVTAKDEEAKTLEGTFSFTATDDDDATNVREITNGSFKVTYL